MRKLFPIIAALVLILSVFLSGCGGSGVSQADYDAIKAQLATVQSSLSDVQSKLTQAQSDLAKAQQVTTTPNTDLQTAQTTITDLQKQNADLQEQITDLKAQYEFIGLTTAQIAEKVVQNYHATHVYSTIDYFVCSDMASEVWNMLKAQGISSAIVIGSIDDPITDIMQSDHAWVLADIGNGEKLALETTGGFTVSSDDKPLYYRGWSFASPADLKTNNDLRKEHDLRVGFRNVLNDEVNKAMTSYNNSTSQTEADKYLTLYNKLVELRTAQETLINSLKAQIASLATQLS